jgi:hypothetical protein
MVLQKYSMAVLRAIFGTKGATFDPYEEKDELVAAGVPWNGYSANDYFEAFKADGYTSSGPTTNAMNANKTKVNNSAAWQAFSTGSEEFHYTTTGSSTQKTVTLSGWKPTLRESDRPKWPAGAYLALFTKMPGKDGTGYAEPAEGTSYMRINLHKAIISGGSCITSAAEDKTNGGAFIENDEIFVYPEVAGTAWGTIVGFGVMSTATPRGGDKPQIWGRLKTPITTQTERVPLFRLGEFRTELR